MTRVVTSSYSHFLYTLLEPFSCVLMKEGSGIHFNIQHTPRKQPDKTALQRILLTKPPKAYSFIIIVRICNTFNSAIERDFEIRQFATCINREQGQRKNHQIILYSLSFSLLSKPFVNIAPLYNVLELRQFQNKRIVFERIQRILTSL